MFVPYPNSFNNFILSAQHSQELFNNVIQLIMTKLSAGVQEKLRQLRVAAGTRQPLTSGNHTEAATAAAAAGKKSRQLKVSDTMLWRVFHEKNGFFHNIGTGTRGF